VFYSWICSEKEINYKTELKQIQGKIYNQPKVYCQSDHETTTNYVQIVIAKSVGKNNRNSVKWTEKYDRKPDGNSYP